MILHQLLHLLWERSWWCESLNFSTAVSSIWIQFFFSCPGSFIPTLVVVGVSATLEILTQRVNFDPWHPRDIWSYDWSWPMTDYTTDPMTNPRIKNKTKSDSHILTSGQFHDVILDSSLTNYSNSWSVFLKVETLYWSYLCCSCLAVGTNGKNIVHGGEEATQIQKQKYSRENNAKYMYIAGEEGICRWWWQMPANCLCHVSRCNDCINCGKVS